MRLKTRKHFGYSSSPITYKVINLIAPLLSDADYPKDGERWGIDISHYTGIISAENWKKIKASGCRFVIIKGMHGKNVANCFKENYAGAKAVGIPVSHYHWLCPAEEVSPAGQARAYAQLCRDYPPDFDAWTDFEYTPWTFRKDGHSVTVTTEVDDLDSFMQTWAVEMPGIAIGIYTSPSYWQEHGSTNVKWRKYRLWIANYGLHTPLEKPNIPLPWLETDAQTPFWQFSENGDGDAIGTAPGERRVDLDYFMGSEEEWQELLLAGSYVPPEEPPIEPPTGEPTMYKYTFICNNKGYSKLNLWSNHSSSSTDVGDLPNGDVVQGNTLWEGNGETWLLAEEVRGQPYPQPAWVVVFLGTWRGTLTENIVTPPPPTESPIKVKFSVNGNAVVDETYPAGTKIGIEVE